MTTKAEWLALAARCEQATGPDREIDVAIWLACGAGNTRKQWSYRHQATGRICEVDETRDGTGRLVVVPSYTASLDAITALIERELPGWRVRWHTDGDGVHEGLLENKDDFGAIDARHTESFAQTPALALCAAFCRAMVERTSLSPAIDTTPGTL